MKVKTEPTSPVKSSGKEKSPSRSPSKRDSSPSKRDSSPTKRDSSPSKRQSNSIKSVKEEEMSDDEIPLVRKLCYKFSMSRKIYEMFVNLRML